MDDHFSLNDSALDMLAPLYGNGSYIFFTQFGGRRHDDRSTLNLGAGVRLFCGSWMYGVNAFLDNDITGRNRRVGVGGEAWTDYLKLSANTYFGMTGWHQSRDFEDYDERPADGFDVAANAWLPAYPQLGGTLKYEQYQGDHVGLMGKDTLQKNPKAITAGLNWTPVPLVTLGADYRSSRGHDEMQLQAQFSWRFGESLQAQMSGDNVVATRTLSGSRLDLVERNNNIVLDYRKQEVVKLSLPAETRGRAGGQVPLNVQVMAKYGVDRIEWQAPEFFAAGGKIIATGPQSQVIQLPAWRAAGNRYPVHAVAWDTKGNSSRTASGDIVVEGSGVDISHSSVTLSSGTVAADGKSTVLLTLTVRDAQGSPLSGLASSISLPLSFTPQTTAMIGSPTWGGRAWTVLTGAVGSAIAEVPVALANGGVMLNDVRETGSVGVYTATLIAGQLPGSVRITPVVSGTTFPATEVQLAPVSSQADTGSIAMGARFGRIPSGVGIVSDGQAVGHLTFTVVNADGQPLSGQRVHFTASGKLLLDSLTSAMGEVTVQLPSSLTPGDIDIIAALDNKVTQTVKVSYYTATGGALAKPGDLTRVLGEPSPAPVHGGVMSYTSSDATKVAVDATTGALEIHAVTGTTPVTITATETAAGYTRLTTTYTVTVTAAPVSAAKSELAVETAAPVAHSPVVVRLKLKDARNQLAKGETGLILTGTDMATAPAFAEDTGNKGTYTVTFTPADAKTYTLGVGGLTGFTKTVSMTTVAPLQATGQASTQTVDAGSDITPFTPVTGSGGTGVLTYALAAGTSLPTGLSMNSTTGAISGNPTALVTNQTYTVEVDDSAVPPRKATATFSLTVNPIVTLKDVFVNGYTFAKDVGFPSTGYQGAEFTLELDGGKPSDFNWKSDTSWVSVGTDAKVSFNSEGSGSKVTITGTPKSGNGKAITYSFTLNSWFIIGRSNMNWSNANMYCSRQGSGYSQPTVAQTVLTMGRGIGALWAEWGKGGAPDIGGADNNMYWLLDSVSGSSHNILFGFTDQAMDAVDIMPNTVLCRRST